ncbi:hypothetical protein L249_3033 [Ophiocordyceps polyrhachis-furcata BCC 54312]|uniref:Exonuclease domain-containing protein n=1 Tax=Ophiocordyceps polyrhachis-furcata BCC 54312 TaxID=1330021 RepID=A0A367LQW3_9HYPO|nr:hypothetical protein L249_3033 [Ophiocordyceps polyrhachis-furcata BCC 54312]
MSLNLKHLPCPAGSNCKAFQCIFGHPQDESKRQAHAAEEAPSDEAPRKRRRLDGRDNLQQETLHTGDDSRSKVKGRSARYTNEEPAARSASPLAVSTTPSPRAVTRILLPNPSPGESAKRRVTSSSTKGDKVETLNPRLLKNSPAPHAIRLLLLKMLHTQYSRLNSELEKDANDEETKLVLNEQQLVSMALNEEEKTAIEKPLVYKNVLKNKVTLYKRMSVGMWRNERANATCKTRSDYSGIRVEMPNGHCRTDPILTPTHEVEILQHILTPIDGLSQYGYVSKVPSADSISAARETMRMSKGWEKCERCRQRFQVFPGRREEDGALTSGGTCKFHWGKVISMGETREYSCCGEDADKSSGCQTHDCHVFKINDPARMAAVMNFAETPENDLAPRDRAVCFDCEMGYTVNGMELIRLTATSWPTGDVLLDVLVQPLGEILDLNSRFSGVWPDDMALAEPWGDDEKALPVVDDLDNKATGAEDEDEDGKATKTQKKKKKLKKVSSPEAARKLLFSLISPTTPLIGHALENDLRSVRIVHPALVDTVLLYPHKRGLPFRVRLKTLMLDHLKREIQRENGSEMTGHDSAEDARAAGELARHKVGMHWKERMQGWKLIEGGGLQPPL